MSELMILKELHSPCSELMRFHNMSGCPAPSALPAPADHLLSAEVCLLKTETVSSKVVMYPIAATLQRNWLFSSTLAWWGGPAVVNVKCCSHLVAAV